MKCLGVHFSDDCSFQHHIRETVKKAKGMAGWVLRTFTSRKPQVMLTLWKALLQPTLDYCTYLGSPHNKGDIQQLETAQRSFTTQIRGLRDLHYWDTLKELNLYSQHRAKDRYRAIYMCKILDNLVPHPTPSALQLYTTQRTGLKCARTSLPTTAPHKIKTLLASIIPHEEQKYLIHSQRR